MGKPLEEKSEPTNRQIRSGTKCNSKQTVEKSNERPEWLPDGWNVDFRTRRSGANMGHGYKCYINPSGNKFYSKPEVLRYLETVNSNSCTSNKEQICKGNDAIEKFTAKDLPPGLITEIKIRKGSNGNRIDLDVIEKSSAEDLPPGWITEAKVRKGGNGNKKDLFYVDPASGYVFRSKKDALRYLKSGDINTCVLKPFKRHIKDEDKITPSSTGKKQKVKHSATKRQLFVDANDLKKGQVVTDSSGMMVAPVPLSEPLVTNQSLENAVAHSPEMKKTSDPDDVQEKNRVVNVLEHASKKNHGNRSLSKTKESDVARRVSRRLSGAEPDQLTNVDNEQTLQVSKRNLRKSRSDLDTDLTNKSFQQLNGVLEIEPSHKMQGEVLLNSNKSSNKKEQQILCRTSKRLAGFEPELNGSISNERAPEYSKKSKGKATATFQQSDGRPIMELADHASINGESSNKGRKIPETRPITCDQLKKFDDEEMNNDEKSEPEQSLAFHYSWSDPCLEFAIQTVTSALPAEDSVGNLPARVSETDMFAKNKLVEGISGSSSAKNSSVNSKKSKNKKELTRPRRLSKRLAGNEPEILPTEKAIEYAARKSCNEKPAATAILINEVSGHLHAKEESKLIVQESDRLKTLCGESSSKSEKSYDTQTVTDEQLQAANVDDNKSDPQFPSPFGDSWSDPCLEFAIKTLTGSLPVEAPAAADILPVMDIDINDPPNKELLECMEQKSTNEEARDNPNPSQTKKVFNTVCQPLKQDLNQPELTIFSTSCGNDPKFATRESYKDEVSITRNSIGRESQRIEASNARQIDINKTILEEEPSEEKHVLEGESVAEKPQPETINLDYTERAFCVPFMDSWSDPCLDFAFKTLTGTTIPVEENIAIQGGFQEPVNRHDQRNGSLTVPDFGFTSISHSHRGLSFLNDIGEKSNPGQQSSTSSSFLPQEKPSVHGFSGVAPQEQFFQYSNNFQKR
ncbi:methyl-CpG-binding domain-containing protein 13 isoform X2 [Cajanus cajan]|uniref:methyl-CpG-binding domain-containing protein 13 isoform X2 n=1 Tax=Cajanus cajan TaxID=3821 RepID=UPI00098DC0E4|nr:methyl-CpG-binding domain-containing protein 13 isoform X2 [Cajanus cajan]